jgi:hypothetical protein
MDCTTADASLAADVDLLILRQRFEGQNLQYLKKGTANAESLTASFWVKSNLTGTFIAEIYDNDNASRQISATYTINVSRYLGKENYNFCWRYSTGLLANDNGK